MARIQPVPQKKLRGATLFSDQAWGGISKALGITRRELQIVHGVFDNLPESGIAQRLGISEHTAHTHLNRLFKKLTVTTRTELVLRVMEQVIVITASPEDGLAPLCQRHFSGGCCLHDPRPRSP